MFFTLETNVGLGNIESKGRCCADNFSLGHVEADVYTRTGPARSALVSEFKFQEPDIVTECGESFTPTPFFTNVLTNQLITHLLVVL